MSFAEMERSYADLRARWQEGRLSEAQFQEQVNLLRFQDPSGQWWQVDAASGGWLAWDGAAWRSAQPPKRARAAAPRKAASAQAPKRAANAAKPQSASARPRQAAASRAASAPPRQAARPASAYPQARQAAAGKLASLTTSLQGRSRGWWDRTAILGGAGGGLLYYLWSSAPRSSEGQDLTSALLMAGLPVALTVLRRPIDKLLAPFQAPLRRLTPLIRIGAGLAAPFLVSTLLYNGGNMSEYPFLRWSVVLGTLASYAIVRTPETAGLRARLGGGEGR